VAWLAWFLLQSSQAVHADDLAAKFLDRLRQRGWHDVALEYLDHVDNDPLASPEFLDRIDYERAVTQAALAKQASNDQQRSDLLAQAAAGFQQYAQSHRESAVALDALQQASHLLTQQALQTLAQARRLPEQAQGEQETLRSEARQLFEKAGLPLQQLLEACDRRLKSLPKPAASRRDAQPLSTRQQLRAKQAEAQFLLAKLSFEKSRTYAAGSTQSKETLNLAAKAFSKLYADYQNKLVGFLGRLYEGRCYQEMGDYKKALRRYEDLINQPIRNPDFRRLTARAYRRRAQCHVANKNFDLAIDECRRWLEDSRVEERRQPEWLAVAFQLADAYVKKYQSLSPGSGDAQRLRVEARQLLREVAKQPGELQRDAHRALASMGHGAGNSKAIKTFADALAAGKLALDQMNSSQLAAKLAAENNPDAVEELRQQADTSKAEALQYFQRAMRLADDEVPIDQRLEVRYYLCWLYWEDDRTAEAAVMGEFLARRYPESKFAVGAAKVALAARERLYDEAQKDASQTEPAADNHFETSSLASLAEWIVQRWPESSESAAAVQLLIHIALRENRLAEAEQLLKRLPKTGRTAAELSLGSGLWIRYLQATAGKRGDSDAEVEKFKQRAAELLSSGFAALRSKSEPSAAEATGVLYLVQVLLSESKFQQAIEVLENPSVGPLALLEKGVPTASRPEFVQEVYKAALRAYVSVEPPQRAKALKMMTALEKSVAQQDNAQRQLTNIYVSLGLQLQRQMKELSSAGKTTKAQAVAAAFEDLLQRIDQRGNGGDWKIRNWIAQTNLQLGQELHGKQAAHYLQQAEEASRAILAAVDQDASFAPSEMAILGVRKRLGDCLRAQQKYADALEQYTKILAEKPNLIELQQAAASVLQQWGGAQRDAGKLEQAILGMLPQSNQKNLVWGWLRLAAVADYAGRKTAQAADARAVDQSKVAKYQSLFFEARYNAAKARYTAALLTQGASRKKQLLTAKRSVESMKKLYPELGGPHWQEAFTELLKKIQADLKS